jgi:hypothetical protein
MKKVFAKYNKNPLGWKVLISNDEKGFPTILFFSRDEVWELKFDSLYKPNPICVGRNFTNPGEKLDQKFQSPNYGFRPLEDDKAKMILKSLLKERTASNIVNEILQKEPKSLEDIEERKMVLHGPIIHSPKLPLISEQQVDLDIKLRSELQKLLWNRGIGSMYS